MSSVLAWVGRSGKRIAITVLGVALIAAGVALMIVPGPLSVPFFIGGLAVLATEYAWAKRALASAKRRGNTARRGVLKRFRRREPGPQA